MYIFKNALINIFRTKGRNILIALIILAISVSATLGLSIRQAAETAKNESLEALNITAQISVDRNSIMKNSGSDKSSYSSALSNTSSLTIDDMKIYAEAESVNTFYYSESISLNGSDGFDPVNTSTSNDETTTSFTYSNKGTIGSSSNAGFSRGSMGTQGDFTLIGYSSQDAMTDFANGTTTLTSGSMFDENTANLDCLISDELASFNNLSVGSTIVVTNPNVETETYTLNIVGIYNNSQSSVTTSSNMRGFSTSTDPANQIYLSVNAVNAITTTSSSIATTGTETTTAIPSQASGTYVFATIADYNAFEGEARALGLSDSYAISSSDVTSYEQGLVPLENLSTMAGYFLIVVLGIGSLVLVVLNIFNIRERKYEVGVLTAIGMKKWKVATQFITEILAITLIAVTLGGAVGAASSVPVTNSLLASQVEETKEDMEESVSSMETGKGGFSNSITRNSINYVSEVSSAVNITVLFQLLGVFILLALIAGCVSVIFIMRYEPLKILSNRD